jgi:hypothetical protein
LQSRAVGFEASENTPPRLTRSFLSRKEGDEAQPRGCVTPFHP